jgi:ATP-dependent Zn protease
VKRKSNRRLAYERLKANPPPLPPLVSKGFSSAVSGYDSASHEAGHAVAAIIYGFDLKSVSIKIQRLGNGLVALGQANSTPVKLDEIKGKGGDAVMPHLVTILAGAAAESALNPGVRISDGAQADREEAFGIAVAAVCNVPDSNVVSPGEMARTKSEREALLKCADAATDRFVALHTKVIQRVASLLREQEELTGECVAEIVRSMVHPGVSVGNP